MLDIRCQGECVSAALCCMKVNLSHLNLFIIEKKEEEVSLLS